jgi:prolyl-tRNA synthetase
MRLSQYFIPTLREAPQEAETMSHKLMLRAGMIRQLASGLYAWLPLGLLVLENIIAIIREEMEKVGAIEVLLPTIQPAELWQESGRWDYYGPELLRLQDRHQRDFCFGPTHEEVITDLARREIRSYRQLPKNFFQIQIKFRDEIRPRFGVMRAREFLMKDGYSFHATEASLQETYQQMNEAYQRILSRMGLLFRVVDADTGQIGGAKSHEFHVLADAGEDTIAFSLNSDYAANIERAETLPLPPPPSPQEPLQKIATPHCRTVAEVAARLRLDTKKVLKTLILKGRDTPFVAVLLRGDHELNPIKAEKHPKIAAPLAFANEDEIRHLTGASPGSIGPIGLSIPIIADYAAVALSDFCCGANEDGFHYIGANFGRDLPFPESADLRWVVAGDPAPDGSGPLELCRGIEVGHIFQLGTRYSKAMGATFQDQEGKEQPIIMGCYGMGVSRLVAATIEQHHDDKGIIWPKAIAPFQVGLIAIGLKRSSTVKEVAEELYRNLQKEGIKVLFDDRDERAGVMFADMDLIGLPIRIVISEKGLAQGEIEISQRGGAMSVVPCNHAIRFIKEELSWQV